jgi:hypothetical protein
VMIYRSETVSKDIDTRTIQYLNNIALYIGQYYQIKKYASLCEPYTA